jgi:predicted RNA-binding protein YlqC (UPF0109 family)
MIEKLIEHVVKQLVDNPELVQVSVSESDQECVLKISVGEQDRGKVIGKQGQTIKALRMLVTAVQPEARRVSVDVVTPA